MTEEKPRSLGMPVEVAKQKLRDDPETKKIADGLGVDLDTYIEKVIQCAQFPDHAEVSVVPDAELAAAGSPVASYKDVTAWFEAVKSGEIDLSGPAGKVDTTGGFTTAQEVSVTMRAAAGIEVERSAPTQGKATGEILVSGSSGAALKEQLMQQRQTLHIPRQHQAAVPPKKKD